MGNKSSDFELAEGRRTYKDEEEETLRPSLEEAYASASDSESSSHDDVDEFDPLNYDAGTLKRKKRRKPRPNLQLDSERPNKKRSWVRRNLLPTRFCCWMIALFFITVVLLLSAGGIWAIKQAPPMRESPAFYPSPAGGSDPLWAEAYKKAAALVRKMDVIEKVNVTTGTGWMMGLCVGNTGPAVKVGFPALCLQDGPLGIRWADNVTAFPAGVTVGATWNKELMFRRGQAHGLEARLKGVNVLLGPAMGPLGRTPLGGRNWEGFGADPVLQGIAAAETIRGIQSQGVIATAKHFVGNEQEHFRQSWEWATPNAISSNIDDRTLHEIYAWPFAESIRAGVGSIMCSYNQVNNSYACQNSKLMNSVLKDQLGFQGFIQSDWLAQRSGVASALAGLDMSMPGDGLRWQDGDSLWGSHLTRSIYNGSLPIERLNDMAVRTVAAWYQMGQDNETLYPDDGPNFSSWTNEQVGLLHPGSNDKNAIGIVNKFVNVQGEDNAHGKLAREIAAEGIVLLKNEDHILPLRRQGGLKGVPQDRRRPQFHVSIIGEDAFASEDGLNACADRGCNKGTLASGWGSGAVDFPYLVTPADAIKRFYQKDVVVKEYDNTYFTNRLEHIARDSDLCLVFANSDSGEGYITTDDVKADRPDLKLQQKGDQLITSVAAVCGNGTAPVVVVVHAVGPVLMEQFADLPNVKAIVLANLPGQESGNALADVLFGDVNPSGHLPYTIGKSFKDYGESAKVLTMPNRGLEPQQNFSEGSLIDYRHFDYYDIKPRYPFGHGLSYTTWTISDASLEVLAPGELDKATPAPRAAGLAPPSMPVRLPDVRQALFPQGFRKLRKYIYPYLEDTRGLAPTGKAQYPTGYGETSAPSPAGGGPGGNPDLFTALLEIKATVTNTGDRKGKAVVQVYIDLPQDWTDPETGEVFKQTPKRVLRAFEKVAVDGSGKAEEVTIRLTRKDLSLWSTVRQNWLLPFGDGAVREVKVGWSSRDLPISMKY